jgi:hypothetical protein
MIFRTNRSTPTRFYFFIAGGIVAIEFVVAFTLALQKGTDPLHVGLTAPWALAGVLVPILLGGLFLLPGAAQETSQRRMRLLSRAYVLSNTVTALIIAAFSAWIAIEGNRRYVIILALIQTLIVRRIWPLRATGMSSLTIFVMLTFGWLLSEGLAFTKIGDAIVGALPETNLFPLSFCAFFVLIPFALAPKKRSTAARSIDFTLLFIGCALFFVWQSLRTDNLLTDWIPYHRSYFTTVADFVRSGRWLLWEVPSQYGFLSVLALAAMPTRDAWEGLYLLTAIVLTLQAVFAFGIFASGPWSRLSLLIVAAIVAAANFSAGAARMPFGPRLYPQAGMRFVLVIALLFIGFRMYRSGDAKVRNRIRIFGTIVWSVGTLWSVENLLWSTVVWVGFIAVEAASDAFIVKGTSVSRITIERLVPLVVFPVALFALVDLVYVARLHHLPDWRAYVEFSSIYASDSAYTMVPQARGGGWVFVLFLSAIGVAIVAGARAGRYHAVPILTAAWLAVWATSTYYLAEPFANHVSCLAPIIVTAIAIVVSVGYWEEMAIAIRSTVAIAFIPYCVILCSYAIAGTQQLSQMRGPLFGSPVFDIEKTYPTIPSELQYLEREAGITLHDPVLFPSNAAWVKINDGLIMPFVRDPKSGENVEQIGWLPFNQTGMINTMLTLPVDRRFTYIEHYLDATRTGGWYLTYHERADCTRLSPRLRSTRRKHTVNFEAAYCVFTQKQSLGSLSALRE